LRLRDGFRSFAPAGRRPAGSRGALSAEWISGGETRDDARVGRRNFLLGLQLKNRDITVALILLASLKIFSSYNDLRRGL
jgi:hypothetical protein